MSENPQKNALSMINDKIINKDKQSLKDDIIFFKEEILKQINELQKNIIQQKEEDRAKINGKFILYDETIEKLNTDFSELKKIMDTNLYIKEKLDDLSHFKKDISKTSTGNNIKLTLLEKDTNSNIYRIDKILSNSIIYPRIIGKNAKFKTFHEFIDYTLENLSTFDVFRGKFEIELNSFKLKVDKIIQSLKIKLDCAIQDCRQIVKNGIKENENIIKDYITGKIYDIQVKINEIEKKVEKNSEEFNLELNTLDEKLKLIDEKFEEKMDLNKFGEEKQSIYYDIKECKKKETDLNTRINSLERYKETQEKNRIWSVRAFGKRKYGSSGDIMNMNAFPNSNQGYEYYNNDNMENIKNNENIMNQNNTSYTEDQVRKNKNQLKINTNDNNFAEIYNNNGIKLNRITIDKNLITTEEGINTNNMIESNNNGKNLQKKINSMNSLYKLRISLKDINAQFNFGNLKGIQNNKSLKDTFTQNFPMATPIHNKFINFNDIFKFKYQDALKKYIEPRSIRNSVQINRKEINFLNDDINVDNLNNKDIITEETIYKNKNKKNEERKKTWERLLSPKTKVKSDLDIYDKYLVNFRNFKKNKTLNRMLISRSSKNFFDNYNKS